MWCFSTVSRLHPSPFAPWAGGSVSTFPAPAPSTHPSWWTAAVHSASSEWVCCCKQALPRPSRSAGGDTSKIKPERKVLLHPQGWINSILSIVNLNLFCFHVLNLARLLTFSPSCPQQMQCRFRRNTALQKPNVFPWETSDKWAKLSGWKRLHWIAGCPPSHPFFFFFSEKEC